MAPGPDAPPSAVDEALAQLVERLGTDMRQLVSATFVHGIRNGIEIAAKGCDVSVAALREKGQWGMAWAFEMMSNQIRLMAHEVQDPEVPSA